MARRNLLRSLLAASLMALSGAGGLLVAPLPAGAITNPDHRVMVYETKFSPDVLYARRGQTVQFDLAPGVSTDHTVTLENGVCADRPARMCEETFDDPADPPVFRFSDYGEYPYYDRYAREAGDLNMQGMIIVTDQPPPPTTTTTTAPPTTSTTMSSTTTTRPATTTTLPPATTTTTAPTSIRPFVLSDTGPTTTTTAPTPAAGATLASTNGGTGTPTAAAKDKGKGDGKGKAGATDTPPSTSAPSDGLPVDVVFDAASLTPLPESSAPAGVTTSDSGPEEAALLDLLGAENSADDGTRVMIIAGGVLALAILLVGAVAWHQRSSRYFPA